MEVKRVLTPTYLSSYGIIEIKEWTSPTDYDIASITQEGSTIYWKFGNWRRIHGESRSLRIESITAHAFSYNEFHESFGFLPHPLERIATFYLDLLLAWEADLGPILDEMNRLHDSLVWILLIRIRTSNHIQNLWRQSIWRRCQERSSRWFQQWIFSALSTRFFYCSPICSSRSCILKSFSQTTF